MCCLFSSLPSRARPREVSTVHLRLLLVASTQDKGDVVMGAGAADMVLMAVAQITWLSKAVHFRVQAGHLSRTLVVHRPHATNEPREEVVA